MESTELVSAEAMDRLDRAEFAMATSPDMFQVIKEQLDHLFTPGLYVRKMTMPAMGMVISKIHDTQHPFIILKGTVSVKIGDDPPIVLTAPHIGVTMPGTRRMFFCHTETEWVTVHATERTTPEEVEFDIIRPHKNSYSDFLLAS